MLCRSRCTCWPWLHTGSCPIGALRVRPVTFRGVRRRNILDTTRLEGQVEMALVRKKRGYLTCLNPHRQGKPNRMCDRNKYVAPIVRGLSMEGGTPSIHRCSTRASTERAGCTRIIRTRVGKTRRSGRSRACASPTAAAPAAAAAWVQYWSLGGAAAGGTWPTRALQTGCAGCTGLRR